MNLDLASSPTPVAPPEGPAARALHLACAPVAWLVLHPLRVPPLVTPGAAGLPYRPVRLRSPGASLAAWHIPRAGSRRGIVLCHGHNNSRGQFRRLLGPLHGAGFHLLLFDFRTMGISGGRVCTYGYRERHDVHSAVAWLREEAGVTEIGLLGYSMGGASALLAAAADPDIRAVATDCAFARLDDMVEQRFFFLPRGARGPVGNAVRRWAERWSGSPTEAVDPEGAVRAWRPRPFLVIHGESDRLIPVEHGRRLAAAAGKQAELWVVRGAGHVGCRTVAGPAYERRLLEFFGRSLAAPGP